MYTHRVLDIGEKNTGPGSGLDPDFSLFSGPGPKKRVPAVPYCCQMIIPIFLAYEK
jgi:hypothetical protein